jgi:CDP-diacylglycerol--glycerol-3-phosphate 3-phosphatidyltransferase
MKEEMRMANLITSVRFALLFLLVAMVYLAPPHWQLVDPLLLILIIALDGVDGYVARRRGETSVFGSVYDIAVDRAVENILWIVLADVELVPVSVALLFITRGILVDTVRGESLAQGVGAFEMMRSSLGHFLVASRFMRGLYGTVKAFTFSWILLIQPFQTLMPEFWANWSGAISLVTHSLILLAIVLCLARGIPVLVEFYLAEKRPSNAGAA